MRILGTIIMVILMGIPMYGQRDETILRNPRLKLTGIWAGSISRVHNFSEDSHYANGGFFTFELNKDYLIGWDGFTVNAFTEGFGDINVSTNGLLLGYAHSGYQVVHPVAYLSLGKAKSVADAYPTVNSFAGHASLGAEFNIFRWFRVGGEIGYRYVDSGGEDWIKDANISSPYAGIKIKFGWSWGK